MKKITAFLLCALLLVIPLCPAASAVSVESDVEYFDDGSYMTLTYARPYIESLPGDDAVPEEDTDGIFEESAPSVLNRLIRWFKDLIHKIFAKQTTGTKTKYCNYFSSDGELLWYVRLEGKFTYNHRKAVCVSSDIKCEILDSDWKLISAEHSEEGNTAKGSFSIRQYKLGVPLKLVEKNLTLTCSKNGTVR